jgi:hypothetical protein
MSSGNAGHGEDCQMSVAWGRTDIDSRSLGLTSLLAWRCMRSAMAGQQQPGLAGPGLYASSLAFSYSKQVISNPPPAGN